MRTAAATPNDSSRKSMTDEEKELVRAYYRTYMREYRKRNRERMRQKAAEYALKKAKEMQAAGLLDDQAPTQPTECAAQSD